MRENLLRYKTAVFLEGLLPQSLLKREEGGSWFFENVGAYLTNYMAPHPRRPY
jgi:hypothetical protein